MGMRERELVAVLVCALSAGACLSTSSYQTARMLPQGATRVTAAVNNYEAHGTDSDGDSQTYGGDGFEAMGSHGINDKLELGGKLSYLDSNVNIFHFLAVPKLSLIPDKLALVVPVGGAYVGSVDTNGDGMDDSDSGHFFETLPGVVGNYPLGKYFELTGATQLVWLVNDDFDDSTFYGNLNVGVRLTPPGQKWALQPEIGITIPISDRDDDNVDYFMQYGLAFHYEFGTPPAVAASSSSATPAPTPAPAPAADPATPPPADGAGSPGL